MFDFLTTIITLIPFLTILLVFSFLKLKKQKTKVIPISVNFFIHRKCNYECKFCFHTAKTSFVLPLDECKRGLTLLKESGMKKINFSGGEPFFKSELLGQLV